MKKMYVSASQNLWKDTSGKVNCWKFFWLAMYAFLGLGLEIVILVGEMQVYGISLDQMSKGQNIVHWVLTCLAWGTMTYALLNCSKKKYGFDSFNESQIPERRNVIVAAILVILLIIEATFAWKGLKPYKEFRGKGILLFCIQYIYYLFETALFVQIIIYGQKFGDMIFKKENIPWGGIMLALTWGIAHVFTQDLFTGIETLFCAVIYGIIYLVLKKNLKWSYLLIAIAFMI